MAVAVVDYGMGNVGSVKNALEYLGREVCVSSKKEDLERASHLILPGVGAFGDGMKNLAKSGLAEILEKEIFERGKPILGICLGMQLFAESGEEGGFHKGLGWIKGRVRRFKVNESRFKIPHIGWDDVEIKKSSPLFAGVKRPIFYFVHSFHLVPENESIITAKTSYGEDFAAAIEQKNIFGLQFHPEKSQEEGLKVLENFLKL